MATLLLGIGLVTVAPRWLVPAGPNPLHQLDPEVKPNSVGQVEPNSVGQVKPKTDFKVKPIFDLEVTANSVGMEFVRIPGGEFLMGTNLPNPEDPDEAPSHKVRITKPFYLCRHEVTQGQYQEVTSTNPSHFHSVPSEDRAALPVEMVSWFDAIKFCNKLSQRENKFRYYEVSTRGDIPDVRILGGTGYRLPTEAEWEYAAKAGFNETYCFGNSNDYDTIKELMEEYSWHSENAGGRTHPVGRKTANKWGLFDMNGNVSEWVWDRYARDYYARSPGEDPAGPNRIGEMNVRIDRHGSFDLDVKRQSNTARHDVNPTYKSETIGFRVARTAE